MNEGEVQRRLKPVADSLLGAELDRILAIATARNVRPMFALVTTPTWAPTRAAGPVLLKLAREKGFDVVELPDDVYDGVDPNGLTVASWDYHPNAKAHALVAAHLYDALVTRLDVFPAAPPPAAAGVSGQTSADPAR
jgi:hypothetical protein